ncbi:MAG: hypothetical protein ACPG7F_03775 [Aggregatilineales bacterium]
MSDYTLNIPEKLYQYAGQIAESASRSVDSILLEQLQLWTESIPLLNPDEEAELQALRYLSDDALWTIAREQMPQHSQTQMQTLMDKNSRREITSEEYALLNDFVERGQRLMLRKSEAAALLTERGHNITKQDMAARD